MTIYLGNNFLVDIEIDGKWQTIKGLYETKFNLNHDFIKDNSIDQISSQRIHKTKLSYINLSIKGIYTASFAEVKIRNLAFIGNSGKYRILFAGGDHITANFYVTNYEREGNVEGEEKYNIELESSGEIDFEQA